MMRKLRKGVGVFQIVPGSEFRAALWVCLVRSCCRCCSVGCHVLFLLSAVLSQSAVSCQPCNLELNTLFLSFEVSSTIIFRIALYPSIVLNQFCICPCCFVSST